MNVNQPTWLTIDGSKWASDWWQVFQPILSWLNWPITINGSDLYHDQLSNTIHLITTTTSVIINSSFQNYPRRSPNMNYRKYSGQHNQWYICLVHDGKVDVLQPNVQGLSYSLTFGCIFHGMVQMKIDSVLLTAVLFAMIKITCTVHCTTAISTPNKEETNKQNLKMNSSQVWAISAKIMNFTKNLLMALWLFEYYLIKHLTVLYFSSSPCD